MESFYSGRFRGIWPHGVAAEFKASLDVATEGLYFRSRPYIRSTASHIAQEIAVFGASMNLTAGVGALGPVGDSIKYAVIGYGVVPAAMVAEIQNLMLLPIRSISWLSLGGLARLTPDGASPFALDYDLTVGVAHTFNYSTMPAVSFMLRTSLSASWRMTRSFEAGARGGLSAPDHTRGGVGNDALALHPRCILNISAR